MLTGIGVYARLRYTKANIPSVGAAAFSIGFSSFFLYFGLSHIFGHRTYSRIPILGRRLNQAYQEKLDCKKKLYDLVDNGTITFPSDHLNFLLRLLLEQKYHKMYDKLIERARKKHESDLVFNQQEKLTYQGEMNLDLKKVVDQLKDLKTYADGHVTTLPGVLLFGPPGAGKTFTVKYIAQETGSELVYINCASLNKKYFGESETEVKNIYEKAQAIAIQTKKPVIVFLDEFDSLGGKRQSGTDVQNAKSDMLNTLLPYLDGNDRARNVITFMATNKPLNFFDEALSKRLGRIQYKIHITVPSQESRKQMLIAAASKYTCANNIPPTFWEKLIEQTEEFPCDALYKLLERSARTAIYKAKQTGKKPEMTTAMVEQELKVVAADLNIQRQSQESFKMMYA